MLALCRIFCVSENAFLKLLVGLLVTLFLDQNHVNVSLNYPTYDSKKN